MAKLSRKERADGSKLGVPAPRGRGCESPRCLEPWGVGRDGCGGCGWAGTGTAVPVIGQTDTYLVYRE